MTAFINYEEQEMYRVGDTIDIDGREFMLARSNSPTILERWRWWSIAVIFVTATNVIVAAIVAPTLILMPLLIMVLACGVRWGLVPIRHILREEI